MENWPRLQRDFLEGDYMTLKEFAEKKGLNYSSVCKQLGQLKEVKSRKAMLFNEAADLTIKQISDKIMEEQKEAIEYISMNIRRIIMKSVEFAMQPRNFADRKMILEIAGLIGDKKNALSNVNIFTQENNTYEVNYENLTDEEVIQLERLVNKAARGPIEESGEGKTTT